MLFISFILPFLKKETQDFFLYKNITNAIIEIFLDFSRNLGYSLRACYNTDWISKVIIERKHL
nr:hypothetical protein BAU18_03030 [Enterococcus diestrammenae]